MKSVVFFFTFFVLSFPHLYAQDDNVITEDAWISIKLRSTFNKKTTFDFKPTIRYQSAGQGYLNSSLDLTLMRKLEKGWSIALTTRTWLLPNGNYRQFIWPLVFHAAEVGPIKIRQKFLLHYAIDVAENQDDDFFRWQPSFSPKVNWRIKPFVAIEPFFRLNGNNRVERIRYQLGANTTIDKNTSLSCQYWRQESFKRTPRRINNMFVITLNYNVFSAVE